MWTFQLLDALLFSSAGASVLTVVMWGVSWTGRRSSHMAHQLMTGALLSGCLVLLFTLAVRPGVTPCVTLACESPRPSVGDVSEHHFAFSSAGKFSDIGAAEPLPWPETTVPRIPLALLLLWLTGMAVAGFKLFRRHTRTAGLVADATAATNPRLLDMLQLASADVKLTRPVRLLHHPEVFVPMIGGIVRPAMFIPANYATLDGSALRMIMLHELAHLKRRDPLITLVVDISLVCFWFNPLFWLAARRVRHLQEMAADSRVLNAGVKPSRYAACLLSIFRTLQHPPVPAAHSILGGCLVDTRLRDILDASRVHLVPRRLVTATVVLFFVSMSVGMAVAPQALAARAEAVQLQRQLLNQEALDSILRPVFIDRMADRYIAGAAISVVHNGEIVYRQGFGRREVYHEVPVDAETTIFRIGSISKVMTGVAVMQLVDRGLIDLEADVNEYLTEFKVDDTYPEPVRIKHLLTHTAGFDQIGLGRHVQRAEDVRPMGEFLAENLIRIRPPGTVSSYDTYAITLAGYIVEQVSGLSFEEYLMRNIFEPLGMHRSGITVPPALMSDVAVGYEFRGEWFPMPWEFMNTDPASTVNSTVMDMANFARMMLNGGEFNGARILSEQSTQAMMTQQFTNHPDHPGYGLTFFEDRSFGVAAYSHGGSMTGFASFLYLVPEHDLGVYISYTQESGAVLNAIMTELMAALYPDPPMATVMRERWDNPGDLSRFAGSYANNMYHHSNPTTGWRRRPFDITSTEGALQFQDRPAYRVGELDFQLADGVLLSFLENERGDITHLVVNQTVYERLGPVSP